MDKQLKESIRQQIEDQRQVASDGYYHIYDPITGHHEILRWDDRLKITEEMLDRMTQTMLSIRQVEKLSTGGTAVYGEPIL